MTLITANKVQKIMLSKPFVPIGDVKVLFERNFEFSCTSNRFAIPIPSINDQTSLSAGI